MTEYQAPRPTRPPTDPGAVLREDILPALRMAVSNAARHMRISRQTLHRILAEQSAITPEMAVRLGKFCGNGPGIWLRMQQAHDLWHAEQALKEEVQAIPTVRKAA